MLSDHPTGPHRAAPEGVSPANREPGADGPGIRCRRCACAHLYTLETRKLHGGRIMRRRECRHCGHRFATYERAFGESHP